MSSDFKKKLCKLPSNMKKKPQYRDLKIDEILKMDIPKEHILSPTQINAYLSKISSFFKWAVKNGYTKLNPFLEITIKEKQAANEKTLPFSDKDLKLLFDTKIFQEGKRLHPYHYWLPLIGLYTGARIEEICQLKLSDVRKESGIWVFDINSEDDKKTKTKSSIRIIPIHSKLIELGLIKYCDFLEGKNKTRLFPELKKLKDGYSQSASRWFGRYRRKNGVIHKNKKFHSFRNTVVNALKQFDVEEQKASTIAGHTIKSMTYGLYAESYNQEILKSTIEKLQFPINVKPYFDK